MDGQTDMTKLTVAFRNFANAPKKQSLYRPEQAPRNRTASDCRISRHSAHAGCNVCSQPEAPLGYLTKLPLGFKATKSLRDTKSKLHKPDANITIFRKKNYLYREKVSFE